MRIPVIDTDLKIVANNRKSTTSRTVRQVARTPSRQATRASSPQVSKKEKAAAAAAALRRSNKEKERAKNARMDQKVQRSNMGSKFNDQLSADQESIALQMNDSGSTSSKTSMATNRARRRNEEAEKAKARIASADGANADSHGYQLGADIRRRFLRGVDRGRGELPTWVMAGPDKCGNTPIYEKLVAGHPQISDQVKCKEHHFFDNDENFGTCQNRHHEPKASLDQFRSNFPPLCQVNPNQTERGPLMQVAGGHARLLLLEASTLPHGNLDARTQAYLRISGSGKAIPFAHDWQPTAWPCFNLHYYS